MPQFEDWKVSSGENGWNYILDESGEKIAVILGSCKLCDFIIQACIAKSTRAGMTWERKPRKFIRQQAARALKKFGHTDMSNCEIARRANCSEFLIRKLRNCKPLVVACNGFKKSWKTETRNIGRGKIKLK